MLVGVVFSSSLSLSFLCSGPLLLAKVNQKRKRKKKKKNEGGQRKERIVYSLILPGSNLKCSKEASIDVECLIALLYAHPIHAMALNQLQQGLPKLSASYIHYCVRAWTD